MIHGEGVHRERMIRWLFIFLEVLFVNTRDKAIAQEYECEPQKGLLSAIGA